MLPVGKWFRGELRDYLQSELEPRKLPSFLDRAEVDRLRRDHVSASGNHTHLLWAILVLARWLAAHPEVRAPATLAV